MLTFFLESQPLRSSDSKGAGFSLIELMVGISIIAILALIAVPSFKTVLRDIQVRNAAESAASGLQKARAEAVSRNRLVTFRLGADADGTRSSWMVSVVTPSSVVESRDSNEGSASVTRTVTPADATMITFNSLGGVVLNADASASLTTINFNAVDASRPLRVTVGAGGNTRMCEPTISTGTRAC